MTGAGLVWLKDQSRAVSVLGKVPIEAVRGEIELTVDIPFDAEIGLVERPVAGLGRRLVPGQALRLVEPETVGIGVCEGVEFGEFARADPRGEAVGDGMNRLDHSPLLMSITKR